MAAPCWRRGRFVSLGTGAGSGGGEGALPARGGDRGPGASLYEGHPRAGRWPAQTTRLQRHRAGSPRNMEPERDGGARTNGVASSQRRLGNRGPGDVSERPGGLRVAGGPPRGGPPPQPQTQDRGGGGGRPRGG